MNKVTPQLRTRIKAFVAKNPTWGVQDIAAACNCRRVDVRQVLTHSHESFEVTTARRLLSKVPPDRDREEWERCVRMNFADVL